MERRKDSWRGNSQILVVGSEKTPGAVVPEKVGLWMEAWGGSPSSEQNGRTSNRLREHVKDTSLQVGTGDAPELQSLVPLEKSSTLKGGLCGTPLKSSSSPGPRISRCFQHGLDNSTSLFAVGGPGGPGNHSARWWSSPRKKGRQAWPQDILGAQVGCLWCGRVQGQEGTC